MSAGEKWVTASAVKPSVQYVTTEVLVEKQGDSPLTKEMKQCMNVDLQLCYSDPDTDQLLSTASFLDITFKLGYVDDREGILDKVKGQLSELVSENGVAADVPPTSKKAKGLSKILGNCLPVTTTCIE